jgi:hypothetical protein
LRTAYRGGPGSPDGLAGRERGTMSRDTCTRCPETSHLRRREDSNLRGSYIALTA